MNRTLKNAIFCLTLALCFSQASEAFAYNALQPKKPDIHVVGMEQCPYNCEPSSDLDKAATNHNHVDPFHQHASPGKGYIIEILEKIFATSPDGDPKDEVHRVLYQTMSHKRAERRVKAGIYNILVSITKNEKTHDDYLFTTESVGINTNRFYVRADQNWKFRDLKSLQKIKLGLIDGHEYGEIKEHIARHKHSRNHIETTSDAHAIDLNIRKLSKGRFDAIFENKYVVDYHIKAMGLEGVITEAEHANDTNLATKEIYLAFSKESPESAEYIQQFDEGIKRLRNSGKLGTILKKYGLKDWKK